MNTNTTDSATESGQWEYAELDGVEYRFKLHRRPYKGEEIVQIESYWRQAPNNGPDDWQEANDNGTVRALFAIHDDRQQQSQRHRDQMAAALSEMCEKIMYNYTLATDGGDPFVLDEETTRERLEEFRAKVLADGSTANGAGQSERLAGLPSLWRAAWANASNKGLSSYDWVEYCARELEAALTAREGE